MADIFTGTLRMRYDLQYGVGFLHIEVNDRIKTELVKPPTIVDLPSNNIIMNSLEHPEDSQPLSKLVTNAQSVTIVVTSHDDNETAAALLHFLWKRGSIDFFEIFFNPICCCFEWCSCGVFCFLVDGSVGSSF